VTLPVIVGPTAVGKTAAAIIVAEVLGAEIISADSRQLYRGLNIGTAKPTAEERRRVRHHMVDVLDPGAPYSAGQFGEDARACAREIATRSRVPLLVGGSGLYVTSAVDGLFDGPAADPELRERLEERLRREGVAVLAAELAATDPGLNVDVTKPRRIIRALEVYVLTGVPLSRLHAERRVDTGVEPCIVGLHRERSALYRSIEERCERMLAAGLVEEMEELERAGVPMDCTALNTVGYAEVRAYRSGRISWGEMVRLFKQNSRRYAKRQMTWFRRDPRIRWVRVEEGGGVEAAAAGILAHLGR
jgi:tRNA dimethylallyltransferase